MSLPHLAKAPYLKADHVEDTEVVTVIKKPWIVRAEEAQGDYKRDRAYIGVIVDRNDQEYTWGLNVTTYERLLASFGAQPELWLQKKVKIRKEMQTIRGEQRQVLFGEPCKEPQQSLDKPIAFIGTVPSELVDTFQGLGEEQKQNLLNYLKTLKTTEAKE